MKTRAAVTRAAHRLRHPKTTIRWRLTLLYGGLFLVSGAGLLAITYTLVSHASVQPNGPRALISSPPPGFAPSGGRHVRAQVRDGVLQVPSNAKVPRTEKVAVTPAKVLQQILRLRRSRTGRQVIWTVGSGQRISDLHNLIVESGIALGIMAIISGFLGWLVAGRVLRPLRTITAKTQQISEANLHERLALRGPRDELRQLADTIDGLLGRLEAAFDAQRRFVANASHELRTPLTTTRALLELVMTDPHATVQSFRDTCAQVLDEGEHQEQLIDALLALANGQRGVDGLQPIDLAAVVHDALDARRSELATRDLHLDAALSLAQISGDLRLIERLVWNLLDNAIRHNTPGGELGVAVRSHDAVATLLVTNTGPVVPACEVTRLLQPFQRLTSDRVGHNDGVGLGLSIVSAIAAAHEAGLSIQPGTAGGLEVEVRFPQALGEPLPSGKPTPAEPYERFLTKA